MSARDWPVRECGECAGLGHECYTCRQKSELRKQLNELEAQARGQRLAVLRDAVVEAACRETTIASQS